jgi:hypothetical protein
MYRFRIVVVFLLTALSAEILGIPSPGADLSLVDPDFGSVQNFSADGTRLI